jgi:hypothetical protein
MPDATANEVCRQAGRADASEHGGDGDGSDEHALAIAAGAAAIGRRPVVAGPPYL